MILNRAIEVQSHILSLLVDLSKEHVEGRSEEQFVLTLKILQILKMKSL